MKVVKKVFCKIYKLREFMLGTVAWKSYVEEWFWKC